MITRRTFLQAAATAAVAAPRALHATARVQGANDRIRLAVVGTGSRGTMVGGFFARQPDCQVVAACDVAGSRIDQAFERWGQAGVSGIDRVEDYRRVLDRRDVDAVLVATPDHWHGPMVVDACAAGKDVYVEKPVSNAIEPGRQMVRAAREHKRVVQVGLQQRQGPHFQEAARLVRDGIVGPITHVAMHYPGAYIVPPEPEEAPPADLNWELFQGPAPRRPYRPGRQRFWRAFYDYGGGLVTDWGVHLVDVAHWYLGLDLGAPRQASASAQYVNVASPDLEQVPNAFMVSWQYEQVVTSFTNAVPHDAGFGNEGTYFYGPQGCLHVHRSGFRIMPGRARRFPGAPEPPPPPDARVHRRPENYQDDPDTLAQCRNFLDCMRSRERPVSDIEVGFHSTLPCLMGLMAIRQGRTIAWNGREATSL